MYGAAVAPRTARRCLPSSSTPPDLAPVTHERSDPAAAWIHSKDGTRRQCQHGSMVGASPPPSLIGGGGPHGVGRHRSATTDGVGRVSLAPHLPHSLPYADPVSDRRLPLGHLDPAQGGRSRPPRRMLQAVPRASVVRGGGGSRDPHARMTKVSISAVDPVLLARLGVDPRQRARLGLLGFFYFFKID
jgi:hypothetical protein